MLIQHLPPESATITAIRDGMPDDQLTAAVEETAAKYGRWSHSDLLLAQVIDALQAVQWTLVALKTPKKAQQPKPPEPYPRPGVRRKFRPAAHMQLPDGKVRTYLERMREAHRQIVADAEGRAE